MKKVLFIAIVAVASLASCKKDRTCTCTTTDVSSGVVTTKVTVYHDVKKGDARQGCIGSQTTTSSAGYSAIGDNTTCELK